MVCYYTNWSRYAAGEGKYTVDNIPYDQCTHMMYAFVGMNSEFNVVSLDRWVSWILKNFFVNEGFVPLFLIVKMYFELTKFNKLSG